MNEDIKEIKGSVNIVNVINQVLPGELSRAGTVWKMCCPFHSEKTPSFSVNEKKQSFNCFGCGKHGDVIDFLVDYKGLTFKESIHFLSNTPISQINENQKRKETQQRQKQTEWVPIMPVPDGVSFSVKHYKHGVPSGIWHYRNAEGKTMFLVCRFDLPGGKEVLPAVYAKNDAGICEWRFQGAPIPRLIYNLHLLAQNPTWPVLVVEGEKTADAAQEYFQKSVVITWPGGGNAWTLADWTPLAGRKIHVWPDNDFPGRKTMLGLVGERVTQSGLIDHLNAIGAASVKYIYPPGTKAEPGWDLADAKQAGKDKKWVLDYIKSNTAELQPSPVDEKENPKYKPPKARDIILAEVPGTQQEQEAPKAELIPEKFIPPPPQGQTTVEGEKYRVLGYEKQGSKPLFYFYNFLAQQMYSFTAAEMGENNLMAIADRNSWQGLFPRRANVDVKQCVDYLIQQCFTSGIFNPDKMRGRGVWMDDGRVVVHNGDCIFADGQKFPKLYEFPSKFVYESDLRLGFAEPNKANMLPLQESEKLVTMLKKLNWQRPVNAWLLAGWCVLAPMCGAIPWRSHIWITGGAGTGKSWVFEYIVRPLLGNTALAVQGETTEPGLRQLIRTSAMPVVFDEAEGENQNAQQRMQNVLALMRTSSTNDGGVTAKGGSTGMANIFKIRCMFAFASISVQLEMASDRSRTSVLSLESVERNEESQKKWEELQEMQHNLIADQEWVQRLQCRAIVMLPTILENIKIFSKVLATKFKSQRMGDQIGTLIGGAMSLVSNDIVTEEKAKKWCNGFSWDEEEDVLSRKDELICLQYITDYLIRVDGAQGGTVERSLVELLLIIKRELFPADEKITDMIAQQRLARLGLNLKLGGNVFQEQDILQVSVHSEHVKASLKNTPYSKNWQNIIRRIPGVKMSEHPVKFMGGTYQRALEIPLSNIIKKLES